jgi:hypothetical protein
VSPGSSQHLLLPYDTPLGVGQIRTHRPDPSTLVILVGPAPLSAQLLAIVPIAAMVGIFSIWLGALLWSAINDSFMPTAMYLLLPTGIAWIFCGIELAMQFRKWGSPSRFTVSPDLFRFPYPSPRSRLEEVPAKSIVRLRVSNRRSRLQRRDVHALEIEVESGPRFQLLRNYPRAMLEELSDLLAKELGMVFAPES